MAALLSNPNGRYVLTGILMVVGLIVLWVIFLSVQVLVGGRLGNSKATVLQNADEQTKLAATAEPDGFKFFKRKSTSGLVANNEAIFEKNRKGNVWFGSNMQMVICCKMFTWPRHVVSTMLQSLLNLDWN